MEEFPNDLESTHCKSISALGSTTYQEFYSTHIYNLCDYAFTMNLVPVQLSVNRTFLEVSCCQNIKKDLNIKDWFNAVSEYGDKLSFLLDKRLIEVLKSVEKKDGFIGTKSGLDVYYIPDQEYVALYSIDPSQPAVSDDEPQSADGFAIIKIYQKEETPFKKYNN